MNIPFYIVSVIFVLKNKIHKTHPVSIGFQRLKNFCSVFVLHSELPDSGTPPV